MNQAIRDMLDRYDCRSTGDFENALREIFQELALLGLWRGKFFEHCVFYGGTALRILHGLQRFSEDMDFSLTAPDPAFEMTPYCRFVAEELGAWGFEVDVQIKEKAPQNPIKSAFLKAETLRQMLIINAPSSVLGSVPGNKRLKIKLELDTEPPPGIRSETRFLLQPVPFPVRVCTLETLFAGKMHAVLLRRWGKRVKGRDWYDLVWYIGRNIPVDIPHLKARMCQTGDWEADRALDRERLIGLLEKRIDSLDIAAAKKEVEVFLKNPRELDVWSESFFHQLTQKISVSE